MYNHLFRLESSLYFLTSPIILFIAESLAKNSSLTYLDLSYNSFGHDGGLALGDAIIDNRTLKTLLISNNSIDATACFTICVGVIENLALTRLSLNGNPIGKR